MKRGMTLMEIVIIVTILDVIAAIAIPNLINADKRMNEECAVKQLRRISRAQEQYKNSYSTYATFEQFGAEGMIDLILADGTSPGYRYTMTFDLGNWWCCVARPRAWNITGGGATGEKNFLISTDGLIYYNTEENSSEFTKPLGGN